MEISKAKIKLYSGLGLRKHRVASGLFVAEGEKCVLETLPYFRLEALVVTDDLLKRGFLPDGVNADCVFTVPHAMPGRMSSMSTPPQVIAVYEMPATPLPAPDALRGELVLALDGVQDPGNMGTIMRTADWFGVRHIIASTNTVDIFNPKTVQATMGAIGRVSVSYTDLPKYLAEYKKQTLNPVYGTLLTGGSLYNSDLSAEGMIVMGNEGKGLSDEVRQLVSEPLLIPSFPEGGETVESLNVAMATAITLAEFRRRSIS